MDPDATLRRIADLRFDDPEERLDACRDLDAWLRRGGFAPKWDACPAGTREFKRYAPHYFK